jgi:endonuclease VIII-like 1
MPEGTEVRIMSDFINLKSEGKRFNKIFDVQKGNIPNELEVMESFVITSNSVGKQLTLWLQSQSGEKEISVFMGMSGNWEFVRTENWSSVRFVRLRLDTTDGWSLLLHGSYMGPKWKFGKFTGVKRGPDIVRDYQNFKNNVLNNLDKKKFRKPIGEVLMDQEYFNGIGAYLNSEILGRLDIDPHQNFCDLSGQEIVRVVEMCKRCCEESYQFGGGELKDWSNPFGESRIDEWIKFYGNEEVCIKQKFGERRIWIKKKFIK